MAEKMKMPGFRSSRYVVAKFGYLNRGETMNIAILVWEHGRGPDTPVFHRVLHNWQRVHQAFPRAGSEDFQEDATRRIQAIKTVGDYEEVNLKMVKFFLGSYQG